MKLRIRFDGSVHDGFMEVYDWFVQDPFDFVEVRLIRQAVNDSIRPAGVVRRFNRLDSDPGLPVHILLNLFRHSRDEVMIIFQGGVHDPICYVVVHPPIR